MIVRRKKTKAKRRVKSNISSKKSLNMLLGLMKSSGKIPNYDMMTGKKLTDNDRTALINLTFGSSG